MQLHDLIATRIGRYLHSFQDKGLVYTVDTVHGLETYVDTDFVGI